MSAKVVIKIDIRKFFGNKMKDFTDFDRLFEIRYRIKWQEIYQVVIKRVRLNPDCDVVWSFILSELESSR